MRQSLLIDHFDGDYSHAMCHDDYCFEVSILVCLELGTHYPLKVSIARGELISEILLVIQDFQNVLTVAGTTFDAFHVAKAQNLSHWLLSCYMAIVLAMHF